LCLFLETLPLFRAISLGVVAFAVWLLWSGIYQPLIVGLGAVSCLFVIWICHAKGILDEESAPLELAPGLLRYIPWLVWAIIKANVDVALRILSPSLPISPRIIRVKPGQKSDIGRVIYANSITLTPGTVTCDADGDEFVIHALTKAAAADVIAGDMDRRVSKLEGAE
jgi:multicomponent Na+:H+ antiporter subunit E